MTPIGGVINLITYDWKGPGEGPYPGDFLQSRTGRSYLITRRRLGSTGPLRLSCLVVDPEKIPHGSNIFELQWNSRKPRA